jgi:nucleoside-diphosphate-sugar epimerase
MVTGGAGFIGGHITELLVSKGHDVIVFDDFSTGSIDNLRAVQDNVEIVEADIRDIEALNRAMEGVEYVIHQAADISPVRSVEDPAFTNAVNVDGTLNVLITCKDHGVKRVVMASSCAIYGDTGQRAQKEDFVPQPLSPYGASKMAGEHYFSVFYQIYGLETVRLRYFNVFGPRQNPKSQYAAVIPKFIDRILAGKEITINGDGEQTRDFIYVSNVALANYLACTVPNVAGKVFNIASEKTVTINQLAEKLPALAGRNVKIVHGPPVVGDIKYSSSDITLARTLLGFEPKVSFEEGLRLTFEYFAAKAGAV